MKNKFRLFINHIMCVDFFDIMLLGPFLLINFLLASGILYCWFLDSFVASAIAAFLIIAIVSSTFILTCKIGEGLQQNCFPFELHKQARWHHLNITTYKNIDEAERWWRENGKGFFDVKRDTVRVSSESDATYIMLRWGGDTD